MVLKSLVAASVLVLGGLSAAPAGAEIVIGAVNSLTGPIASIGTNNERVIKKLMPTVAQINSLEPQIAVLSDEQLRAKTV